MKIIIDLSYPLQNFIVRGSSQTNTMAVSVRLPPDTGPYIEHYLIQSTDGVLALESSRFKFDSIPGLIAHYAQCCDELPVQLSLPRALKEAKNRQQLSSLALLGQEFWRYPMAAPRSLNNRKDQPPTTHHQDVLNQPISSANRSQAPLLASNQVETPSDTTSSLQWVAT